MGMFKGRYLAHNKSTRFPSNILCLDTETCGHKIAGIGNAKLHKLKMWCSEFWCNEKGKQTRRGFAAGDTAREFWNYVYGKTSKYKPLYIFAHNVGFDITILQFWAELFDGNLSLQCPLGWRGGTEFYDPNNPRIGMLCLTDPPTIIECWKTGTRERIIILDTMNYWRCSLAALGEELGIPKLPMPGELADEQQWHDYCRQDCRIVAAAVVSLEKFVTDHDAGVFKYTIGSQAMASFKHRFNKSKIVIHREPEPLKLERASYRGGEVKVGYCGIVTSSPSLLYDTNANEWLDNKPRRKGPVYVYDVSSFYPSVMLRNEYPIELIGSVVCPSMDTLKNLTNRFFVVADVGIESAANSYPVKRDGVSLMASGKFATALCSPELCFALTSGDVKSISRVCYYKKASIFSEFVRYWYDLRKRLEQEGKRESATAVKTILVSLFGKFGQRSPLWIDRPDIKAPFPFGCFWSWDSQSSDYEYFRSVNWRVQLMDEQGESNESFPAIAAAVTSYGRCVMRSIRESCGQHNFLYQDTDSIHCLEPGAIAIQRAGWCRENEIGYLSLKGIYQECEYRGIKDYTLDGVRVLAGVKRNAVEIAEDQFQQLEFQNLASVLTTMPHDGIMVREVVIHKSNCLPHGTVAPDGTVSPPVLS